MSCNEILSMARESGFYVREGTIRTMHSSGAWVCINDELAKFAEAVTEKERNALQEAQRRLADLQKQLLQAGAERCAAVAAEREACANLCATEYYKMIGEAYGEARYGIAACEKAIRARGAA